MKYAFSDWGATALRCRTTDLDHGKNAAASHKRTHLSIRTRVEVVLRRGQRFGAGLERLQPRISVQFPAMVQYPRVQTHDTHCQDDETSTNFNAVDLTEEEWPRLSSPPREPVKLGASDFPRFFQLPVELQLMVVSYFDLVIDTPEHSGIYLKLDLCDLEETIYMRKLAGDGVSELPACSCQVDCWQKWDGKCCCSHKSHLYHHNTWREFMSWPCCTNYATFKHGLMGASKSLRQEAIKIFFYGQNQFLIEYDDHGGMMAIIKYIKDDHRKLIKKLCVDLMYLELVQEEDEPRDFPEIGLLFDCVRENLVVENLRLRFVIQDVSGPESLALLYKFCEYTLRNGPCKIEILVKVKRSRMMRHPRAFFTLSGPDIKEQIDELFQQGDL